MRMRRLILESIRICAGSILLGIGFFAYFAAWFASETTKDFNYPFGYVNYLFNASNGDILAYSDHLNRLQVYKSNWEFRYGIPIYPRGGGTKARFLPNDRLIITKSRGPVSIIFDLRTNELYTDGISIADYVKVEDNRSKGRVPTPAYFYLLTNMFASWLVAIICFWILFSNWVVDNLRKNAVVFRDKWF